MEQRLIAEYEQDIDELLAGLDATNHDIAVELAGLPEHIRGFGHIKQRSVDAARQKRETLLARFHGTDAAVAKAA